MSQAGLECHGKFSKHILEPATFPGDFLYMSLTFPEIPDQVLDFLILKLSSKFLDRLVVS